MPDPTPAQATQVQPQHQPNPAPASAPDPAMVGTPTPVQPARPTVGPTTTSGLPTPPVPPQPPPAPPKPPMPPRPSEKPEKSQSLSQKLADIHDRVETAANSRVFAGKAEAFADAWADLDDIGSSDKPAEAAQIQAAHNHLQHHAPRRASEIDSLEQQLDEATSDKPRPQAVPDSPQLANVKARIAALQTDLARDPRALPSDKERAQALQERVDEINAEKATAGAK